MHFVEKFRVSDNIWSAQMLEVLLVAHTKNAVDVLEDQLKMTILVFEERWNMWETVSSLYRCLGHDDNTTLHKLLASTRYELLPFLLKL